MVKEKRIIFEVNDLVALRYQCGSKDCSQEMLLRLDNGGSIPYQCPSCRRQWYDRTSEINPIPHLLDLLRLLHDDNRNSPPVKVKFELHDPDN